jgi:hypothetical protein
MIISWMSTVVQNLIRPGTRGWWEQMARVGPNDGSCKVTSAQDMFGLGASVGGGFAPWCWDGKGLAECIADSKAENVRVGREGMG